MKQKQINFRVSEENHVSIKAKALELGVSTTEYILARLLDSIAPQNPHLTLTTSELQRREKAAETIIRAQSFAKAHEEQSIRRGECLNLIFQTTDEIANYIVRHQNFEGDEKKLNSEILSALQHIQNFTLGNL